MYEIRPEDRPLINAAVQFGEWLGCQPEVTEQQQHAIAQMLAFLGNLPAPEPVGWAGEFGVGRHSLRMLVRIGMPRHVRDLFVRSPRAGGFLLGNPGRVSNRKRSRGIGAMDCPGEEPEKPGRARLFVLHRCVHLASRRSYGSRTLMMWQFDFDKRDEEEPRGDVGVLVSLVAHGNGRTRLVFDDVSPACMCDAFAWDHEALFALVDVPTERLERLDLSKDDLAQIGANVVVRLLERTGRVRNG